jgi:hypothetical protein
MVTLSPLAASQAALRPTTFRAPAPQALRFRTVPIPAALAHAARETRRSPQYGHPAHRERAAGYGPCRLCLETFRVGEEDRLLFTYNPFDGLDPYPSPGPVFVHADGCEAFA